MHLFKKLRHKKRVIDIKKIVKTLEESGLQVKGISETIKNETKEQKGGFLPMLLGALAASLLGSSLTGKREIRAGERVVRAGENVWFHSILLLISEYKDVSKTKPNLMALFQQTIYLKQRMGHIY